MWSWSDKSQKWNSELVLVGSEHSECFCPAMVRSSPCLYHTSSLVAWHLPRVSESGIQGAGAGGGGGAQCCLGEFLSFHRSPSSRRQNSSLILTALWITKTEWRSLETLLQNEICCKPLAAGHRTCLFNKAELEFCPLSHSLFPSFDI